MEDKIYDIEINNNGFFANNTMIKIKFTKSHLIICDSDKDNYSPIDTILFKENYENLKLIEEELIFKLIGENKRMYIINTQKKDILEKIKQDLNIYKLKYIVEKYLSDDYKILKNDGINIKMSYSDKIEFFIHMLIPRLIDDLGKFLDDYKKTINEELNTNKQNKELYYKMYATLTEMNKKVNELGNISKNYINQLKENINMENLNNQSFNNINEEDDEEKNNECFHNDINKNFKFIQSRNSKLFQKEFIKLKMTNSIISFHPKHSMTFLSTTNMLNNNNIFQTFNTERISLPYQLKTKTEFFKKIIAKYSNPLNSEFNICLSEPLTQLQKSCEKFFYDSFYKNSLSLIPSDEKKLSYIVSFLINELSLNIKRYLFPIQPIVNETFEYIDLNNRFKFISEQVEENISAYYCELKDIKYYANNNGYWKYNLLNKVFEYKDREIRRIELKCENEILKFAYNVPILQLKNILIGKPYFDYRGIVNIYINRENNNENQSYAEINFNNNIKGGFDGKIYDKKGDIIYNINGNIYDSLYLIDVTKEKKILLWQLNKEEKYLTNKLGHYHDYNYYLPTFSYNLNNDNNNIMKNLPLTDSRYRKDIREYEKGNLTNASYYNGIIIKGNKNKSKAIYFEKVIDNYGIYYKYKGNYFDIKNKRDKNINLTNEEEKLWNRNIFNINKEL